MICTVGDPNKGHLIHVFLEFKNIQRSKIEKKTSIMGRKLSCVDFDFWRELEKCLERVEKGENAGELHTLRGSLIRYISYKLAFPGRNRAWVIS